MLSDQAADLLGALRYTLARWTCTVDGGRVEFIRDAGSACQPMKHPPSWEELLDTLEAAFADHGIARGRLLPLRGNGEADFTISAVQAIDPHVKQRQPFIHSSGYIPQPVVRFTGDRDADGALQPGFLTSFVNVSCVQPVTTIADHARLIDAWLSVLSSLGFHASQIAVVGTLATWTRHNVSGVTLRFRHHGLTLGDAVLLWNREDPLFIGSDIGSGLERLKWALTRASWPESVFGCLAAEINPRTLDAVRTAVLIAGSGIRPSTRGPGGALRRLLRNEKTHVGALGLSRIVRWAHRFWSAVVPLPTPWPEICRVLEAEIFDDG